MAAARRRKETPRQRKERFSLARHLALALCGGVWEPQPASERLEHVLGRPWPFVPTVVDRALSTWLSPPSERRFDDLIEMIATHGSLRYYLRKSPPPTVVNYPLWPLNLSLRREEWATVALPQLPSKRDLARHLGLFDFELE